MKIHIVKKGDTLYFIGQKYNVSLEEILKLNPGITNPDVIDVGMKLKIPSSSQTGGHGGGMDIMHQHVVKQGDTLWKLSKAWGVPLGDMIKANPQLKNPNVLLTGEIVNIPKAGSTIQAQQAATPPPGVGGANAQHPNSFMQGVQGLVGKLSTAPIFGKTPTSPITEKAATAPKAPTAPITEKAPTAPITEKAPTAPIAQAPAPAAPIQEKKPTAPIIKPTAPGALAVPEPAKIEPVKKKALPIEKPVEKKAKPIHEEHMPNVDLFKQYGIPATEAISLYDFPTVPENASPTAIQPTYNGYGKSMTLPAQTGYGHSSVLPAQAGFDFGSWQHSVTYVNTVSPAAGGNPSYDCPPGSLLAGGGYGMPSTLPASSGPSTGYGYGGAMQQGAAENSGLNALSQPNQGWVAPSSAMPNQGFVSPLSAEPNQGWVSPLSAEPNQGWVSPLSAEPNQGWVSPSSAMPNQGFVSPLSAEPNQGFVSPLSAEPNQGWVTPSSAMPNQGFVSPLSAEPNQGLVSPSSTMPNQGFVSPLSAEPNQGWVSPSSAMPNQGFVSPLSAEPNQGLVSPSSAMPNQGFVSPLSAEPNQGFVSPSSAMPNQGWVAQAASPNEGMVSPASLQPGYGHGYGSGAVSPSAVQPQGGYGYPYPVSSYNPCPPYPIFPTWQQQTAGVSQYTDQSDCGCKGERTELSSVQENEAVPQQAAKKQAVPRKNTKKAVIRTVASRPAASKKRNKPWLNR